MRILSGTPYVFGLIPLLFAGQAGAESPHSLLSSAKVQKLEATLRNDPYDRAARGALLDHYLYARIDAAVAVAARRRHILWLIENAPEDEVAGSPAAVIDPIGHWGDPAGFKLAADAWRAQVAKPGAKPSTLAYAAYFFKTDDKEYAISLLKRALALDPTSKEIGARLGDEYARVILGVAMLNRSDYPVRSDPGLAGSALAIRAREELAASRNPYVLAKAGYQLLWQGDILYYSRRLPFDPEPLAKGALDRAVSLASGDSEVSELRKQYDAFQRMKPGIPGPSPSVLPGAPPIPAAVPLSAAPPPRQMTADDLKKASKGMTREQLLRLGAPAGRITMDEDGHLVELYQYSVNGANAGAVRLTDGIVTSVQIR